MKRKLEYLYPNIKIGAFPEDSDCVLESDGKKIRIRYWDKAKLGNLPDEFDLAKLDTDDTYKSWKDGKDAEERAEREIKKLAPQEVFNQIGQFTPSQIKGFVEDAFPDPKQRAVILKLALGLRYLIAAR